MAIAQRVVRSTATRGCAIQRNLVAYRPHKGGGLQQSRAHADPAFAAWMRSSCQQLCGGCKLQKGASTIAWCKGTSAIAWCIGACQQLCDLLTAGANQALNFSNRLKVAGMIIQQCIREYSAIEHPLTWARRGCQVSMERLRGHHLYTARKAEWRGYRGPGCESHHSAMGAVSSRVTSAIAAGCPAL